MKDKILKIVGDFPKHYTKIIKKNSELSKWVIDNSLLDCPEVNADNIYSAVFQIDNRCCYGKTKKLSRWSTGFVGCGPAKTCACTKESISQNVKKTKNQYTSEQHKIVNDKRSNTMLSKYGVAYNSQRSDIKHCWTKPKISQDIYNKLIDREWLYTEYVEKNRTAVDVAHELGIYYSTVLDYCVKHGFDIRKHSNYSLTEIEIRSYIESLNIEYQHNMWDILETKEIDLFIPSKMLAIEINGLYWHSWHPTMKSSENRTRHLEKTQLLLDKGIDLIHITDWEWRNQQDIIKSMLNNRLGLSQRYWARKTQIRDLTTQQARKFFQENHLQGFIHSQYYIGLYDQDQLLMAISAGHSRFKKDKKIIELHRLATKKYCLVVGGGSKLISELKRRVPDSKIISYCDRSKSTGKGYIEMGFSLVSQSGPGYFWTNGNEIISRYKASKKRLERWLPDYDSSLSESQNMFNQKYRRFWDCGNLIFEL
jgi:hypothetical protein